MCVGVCCCCRAPICEQHKVTRSPRSNRRIGPWPRRRVSNPALMIGRYIQISIFDIRSTREATSRLSISYQALAHTSTGSQKPQHSKQPVSVCLSVFLSVRPSVRPSFRPSVHPSVRPSVHLSVCVSVPLSQSPWYTWLVSNWAHF